MSRLQSSGQISASDINVELRRPWNATFSLWDGLTRQLAREGGGEFYWSQFHGAQLYVDQGTPLGDYCFGYTLFRNYADGNGGSASAVVEYNSPTCGYTPPPPPPPQNNNPPYGTFLSQYCTQLGDLIIVYADGGGGSFTQSHYNPQECPVNFGEQG